MKHDMSHTSRDESQVAVLLDNLSKFVTQKRQDLFNWFESVPDLVKVSVSNALPHTLLFE